VSACNGTTPIAQPRRFAPYSERQRSTTFSPRFIEATPRSHPRITCRRRPLQPQWALTRTGSGSIMDLGVGGVTTCPLPMQNLKFWPLQTTPIGWSTNSARRARHQSHVVWHASPRYAPVELFARLGEGANVIHRDGCATERRVSAFTAGENALQHATIASDVEPHCFGHVGKGFSVRSAPGQSVVSRDARTQGAHWRKRRGLRRAASTPIPLSRQYSQSSPGLRRFSASLSAHGPNGPSDSASDSESGPVLSAGTRVPVPRRPETPPSAPGKAPG
jgi:hypothetical protein